MPAVDFALCNAFSHSPSGGNPAATFFMNAPLQNPDAYQQIAATFNQPIANFVSPKISDTKSELASAHVGSHGKDDSSTLKFSIRWFTPTVESPICGHGTIATAYTMFASGRVPPSVSTLHFEREDGAVELYAQRIQSHPYPQIEVELAAFEPVPISDEEFKISRDAIALALKRTGVKVKEVLKDGSGLPVRALYHLIVLEDDEELSGINVDSLPFVHVLYFPALYSEG